MAKKRISLLTLAGMIFAFPALSLSGDNQSLFLKPRAGFQMEFGVDSLERKYYRPEFSYSWPLPWSGDSRFFTRLEYWQRINSRLKGTVDFWLRAGFEKSWNRELRFEAGLNHFCRHMTSIFNPVILDVNELLGRLWISSGSCEVGMGFGGYIGGDPGYDNVAVANLNISHFLLEEIRFESEFKWVNFSEILYEAGFSVALEKGVDLFFRNAKHYKLPATSYLGVRFRTEETEARFVEQFKIAAGFYPFFNTHKLLAQGAFRLEFLKREDRRFFGDLAFDSPILSGASFFSQFWPDRMLYTISADYERQVRSGLRLAWYARYFVDMPADKDQKFRASLGTGLALRNQPDFDRLGQKQRFEIIAGYNFKYDYDFGLKLGLNTLNATGINYGADFRLLANNERRTIELKLFADCGEQISLRPFIGWRATTLLVDPLAEEEQPFKRKLFAGISFFKWY